MDKKNTILLTVIAVATLLVAVVGATFAYFSVTVSQDGNTTTVTAKAGEVGSVAIKGSQDSFTLEVTADDMAQPSMDTNYYAIKTGDEGTTSSSTHGGKWHSSPQDLQVGSIALTGGSSNEAVECNTSILVNVSGTMASKLKSGDAKLTISGDGAAGIEPGVTDIDLYTITEGQSTGNTTYTGKVILNGPETTKNITAQLYLVNKTTEQNDLAGNTLTVQFTFSATCSIQKAE